MDMDLDLDQKLEPPEDLDLSPHPSEIAKSFETPLGGTGNDGNTGNTGNTGDREAFETQLAVESALDPRSQEFQQAVKLTPATLAYYRTQGQWLPAEHLLYVSSILASEIAQGDARIIVEMPPRHGKSELISIHTPVWFLEHYPWANVILTTYAADLATGFGRRVRDAFLEDQAGSQFLKTRIRSDVQRTDIFLTTEGGGMASVGIGGPITGRGAHLLVVDDFIKNWTEASSPGTLDSIWNWFATTAYTRLEPGGSCVILATRWVISDLIDRLKEQDKDNTWVVIRLPALAEKDGDPLNRRPGEALWPKRYSRERLLNIEKVLGTYIFSAMYQQNPLPVGESQADVSMFRIIDEIQHAQLYRWVRSWDLAATKGGGDYTAGTLMGTQGRIHGPISKVVIADQTRERWSASECEDEILKTAEKDGVDVQILIEQEPGASGKAYAQHLATNVLRGYRVEIKPPSGRNKWIRAQPYIAAVSHGRMQLLRASWNETLKKELKEFPNGKHDDTVDSAGQAFNHLHLTSQVAPTWGRPSTEAGNKVIRGQQASSLARALVAGATWGRRVFAVR